MKDEIKQNIKERKTWLRGLYMVLFLVFYSVAKVIIFAVIAFQFILTLLTGKINERLIKLSQSLCTYIYQILSFLTFNSNEHPYPFGVWPTDEPTSQLTSKPKSKPKSKVTSKPTAKKASKKDEKDEPTKNSKEE